MVKHNETAALHAAWTRLRKALGLEQSAPRLHVLEVAAEAADALLDIRFGGTRGADPAEALPDPQAEAARVVSMVDAPPVLGTPQAD